MTSPTTSTRSQATRPEIMSNKKSKDGGTIRSSCQPRTWIAAYSHFSGQSPSKGLRCNIVQRGRVIRRVASTFIVTVNKETHEMGRKKGVCIQIHRPHLNGPGGTRGIIAPTNSPGPTSVTQGPSAESFRCIQGGSVVVAYNPSPWVREYWYARSSR